MKESNDFMAQFKDIKPNLLIPTDVFRDSAQTLNSIKEAARIDLGIKMPNKIVMF